MKLIASVGMIVFLAIYGASCSLFESSTDKKEKLPQATQEGKNTFGCLVNGKVWVPKGYNGFSNLNAYYDPLYQGGTFSLSTYRILSNDEYSSIGIFMTNLIEKGQFDLEDPDVGTAIFDYTIDCSYNRDDTVYREGLLTITRFDLQNYIISGTFEFTLARVGCDTLKVTEGRFDMKL